MADVVGLESETSMSPEQLGGARKRRSSKRKSRGGFSISRRGIKFGGKRKRTGKGKSKRRSGKRRGTRRR